MKMIILLFFTLIISSCGQTKEKKALCQAFDDIESCAKKTTIEDIQTCSANAMQNMTQKLQGGQLKISASKRTEYDEAGESFQNCLSVIESSKEDTLSLFKDCFNRLAVETKSIFECN